MFSFQNTIIIIGTPVDYKILLNIYLLVNSSSKYSQTEVVKTTTVKSTKMYI